MSKYDVKNRYDVKDLLNTLGEGEKTTTDMTMIVRGRDMVGDFSVMEGVIQPGEWLAPTLIK